MDEKKMKKVVAIYFKIEEGKDQYPGLPVFELEGGQIVEMYWVPTGACWYPDFRYVAPIQPIGG